MDKMKGWEGVRREDCLMIQIINYNRNRLIKIQVEK